MAYLVTYNMQGGGNWINISNAMLGGVRVDNPNNPYAQLFLKADVMCLQECGTPTHLAGPATVVDANAGLSRYKFGSGELYCLDWGNGNNRCSLAVASRHPITKYHVLTVGANLRPLLGIKTTIPGRMKGTWIYSGHMPSGNHNFASACAFDTIKSGQMTGEWILAGDFNCTPAKFTHPPNGRAWAATDSAPVHSGGATHVGGNNLDYAVSPNIALQYYNSHGMSSDHCSVWFTF